MPHKPRDESGRTLYGAYVHLDLFPLRYLAAIVVLAGLSTFVPGIVTIVLTVLLAATAMYNLAALRPANYKKR
jgi:hypothetical protein